MKKLTLAIGLGLLTTIAVSAENSKVLLLDYVNGKYDDPNYNLNLGFGTYPLNEVLDFIVKVRGYSQEEKAKMVMWEKRLDLNPFEYKRERAKLIKEYETGIKIAKDFFSAKTQIHVRGSTGNYYAIWFQSQYDINKQRLRILRFKDICKEDIQVGIVTLLKKRNCKNAYVSIPENKAEEIYNLLEANNGGSLSYDVLASYKNKIDYCAKSKGGCLHADLKSAKIKLEINNNTFTKSFEFPLKFD